MTRAFWNEPQRREAQALLDELTHEGNQHGWVYGPMHELRFRALAAVMNKGWPNGSRIRWELLREAVNRCIVAKVQGLAQVESALSDMWEHEQKLESQARAFQVFVPIQLRVQPQVPLPFELIKSPLIRLCVDAGQAASVSEWAQGAQKNGESIQPDSMLLQATVQAGSSGTALYRALPYLTASRNALNLVISTSTIRVQFVQTCRCVIAPPDRAIVIDPERIDNPSLVHLESDGGGGFSWDGVADWHLNEATALLSEMTETQGNSLDRLFSESLRVFGLALDQPKWTFAFVLLWQTAEHLTLPKGERGNHSEVCRRLSMLCGGDSRIQQRTRAALDDVERMRNDIVHGGALGLVESTDVHFLERCCASALYWLRRSRAILPTVEHLWEFYRVASSQTVQIDRSRWVLERLAQLKTP